MRFLLFLLAATLHAQPTGLRVVGVPLPTQAVISYTSPIAGYCTVEVSHESDYMPLIHDVNGSLFTNADRDLSRASTVTSGLRRTVIIGAETSDVASNVWYSRALFADKGHYVRVTCDGNSAAIHFTTPSPRVGDLFAKVPPFNSAAFGNRAWPTMSPTDQTTEYADPMTGVALRLATKAGEYVRQAPSTVLFGAYTGGTGWTNPGNILAHSATTYAQTTNTNAIVVYPDPRLDETMFMRSWKGFNQVDDIGLYAFAEASSGTGDDEKFAVCLSLDAGVSCHGNEIISDAAVDGTSPLVAFNTNGKVTQNYPSPYYGDWGRGISLDRYPVQGNWENGARVTVASGVATVSYCCTNSYNLTFPYTLAAGHKIWIEDSSPTCTNNLCTVASWDSTTQITLSETGLSVSSKQFYTLSFGIRIRKVNANGTLSISVGYRSHGSSGFTNAAPANRYNLNSFTSGDGKEGRLCVIQTAIGSPVLMFCGNDGTMRLLSIGKTTGSGDDDPLIINELHMTGFNTFHPTDPKIFYVITRSNHAYVTTGGDFVLYKVTYTGDASASHVTNCGPAGDCTYVDDDLTWENLTPGSTGNHLQGKALAACGASYSDNVALYGAFSTAAPGSGKYAIFYRPYASQDGGPAWYMIIDVLTATVTKCFHSLTETTLNGGAGFRWGTHHAVTGVEYPVGTLVFSYRGAETPHTDRPHSGPFQFTPTHVMRSGSPSTNTALPWPEDATYDRACPVDIEQRFIDAGATGNVCVTMRGKHPCNLAASDDEEIEFPCPWGGGNGSQPQLLALGDSIVDSALSTPFAAEHMTLVKMTDLGSDVFEFVFHRDSSKDICSARHGENNAGRNTHTNGWTAWVAVTGYYSCDGSLVLYKPETDEVAEIGKYIGSGHWHLGRAVGSDDLSRVSFVTNNPGSIRDSTMVGLTGFPPPIIKYRLTGFGEAPSAGVGYSSDFNLQSYMKRSAYQRDNTPWALDVAPILPNAGTGIESDDTVIATRSIALESGTTQVYKIGLLGSLRNIKYAPLHGMAGRFLLQEKSSATTASHTLTDADTHKFCYAYKDGECRTDSSAGEIFVSVPKAFTSTNIPMGQSYKSAPVVYSGYSVAGMAIRRGMAQEVNGDGIQILSGLLSTTQGHYHYTQLISDPLGKWAISNASSWRQGEHVHALMMKLPGYERDSVNRSTYQPIPIKVPVNGSATHARIRFGVNQDYHCMPRAEACVTDTVVAPYAFIDSDAPEDPTECDMGCTINMPARTGIYYYRIEWMSGGSVVETGPMTVLPVL